MSHQSENLRSLEMLEATKDAPIERKLLVGMASSLEALMVAIAATVGHKILTDEGATLRKAFRGMELVSMMAVCKDASDIKYFMAVREAITKDLQDLRDRKNGNSAN